MGFFSNLGKAVGGFFNKVVENVKSIFEKPEPKPEPKPATEPEPEEIENDWEEIEETENPHIFS